MGASNTIRRMADPAESGVTGWIQNRANELLRGNKAYGAAF